MVHSRVTQPHGTTSKHDVARIALGEHRGQGYTAVCDIYKLCRMNYEVTALERRTLLQTSSVHLREDGVAIVRRVDAVIVELVKPQAVEAAVRLHVVPDEVPQRD